jgi:hypothetical protein
MKRFPTMPPDTEDYSERLKPHIFWPRQNKDSDPSVSRHPFDETTESGKRGRLWLMKPIRYTDRIID